MRDWVLSLGLGFWLDLGLGPRLRTLGGIGVRVFDGGWALGFSLGLGGVNNALLGKWLLRLGDKSPGLWHRLMVAKYRLMSTG